MELNTVSKVDNLRFAHDKDAENMRMPEELAPGEEIDVDMHIFRTGSYKHPVYGLISFSEDDLKEIVQNFKKGVRAEDVVLNENHLSRKPALGWLKNEPDALKIKQMEFETPEGEVRKEKGLFGTFSLNKKGYKYVLNKMYKYLSAEIDRDWTGRDVNASPKEGDDEEKVELRSYGSVITGAALTNNPFIPNLSKTEFSEGERVEQYEEDFVCFSDQYKSPNYLVAHKENCSQKINNDSDEKIFEFYNFKDVIKFSAVDFQDHSYFENRDKDWDGDEAERDIRSVTNSTEDATEKYKKGFLWYDSDEPKNLTSYKMPVCMSDGGELKYVWNGVVAAAQAVRGARNEVDIPSDDLSQVKNHIEKLYEKAAETFDDKSILPAPWNEEKEQENSQQQDNQNFNNQINTTGVDMKISEVFSKLKSQEFSNDVSKQLDFLQEQKVESDDQEFNEVVDTLIEQKKQVLEARKTADKAIQQKQQFKQKTEKLEDEKQNLKLKNKELKEQGWQHQVEQFSKELEEAGHHQSVVNKVKERLSSLDKGSRKTEFSFTKEDETEELGVIEFTREVLEQLPEGARLDESENLHATQDIPADPDAGKGEDAEEDGQEFSDDEGGEQELTPEEKYEQKFGEPVPASAEGALKDDGTINWQKVYDKDSE